MTGKYKQIFLTFLESLESINSTLIESIKKGFIMYEGIESEEYDAYEKNYTVKTESPESIQQWISYSPTLQEEIQSNNIQNITKLELSVSVGNVNGKGYSSGSRDTWDSLGEDSRFEDGIQVGVSGMIAHVYENNDSVPYEFEIPETDSAIYDFVKSKAESNAELYENTLRDAEKDIGVDKFDF